MSNQIPQQFVNGFSKGLSVYAEKRACLEKDYMGSDYDPSHDVNYHYDSLRQMIVVEFNDQDTIFMAFMLSHDYNLVREFFLDHSIEEMEWDSFLKETYKEAAE